MKRLLLILCAVASAFGQTAVNQTSGPPPTPFSDLYFYDASSNLQYDCRAPQKNVVTSWARSDASLTSIVDSSTTSTLTFAAAHGLYPGARITIKGATVDTDLNGTYTVLTTPLSTTATITTASVADATYNEATLIVTTTNPITTSAIWAIRVFTYSSGLMSGSYWATAATTDARLKCSERTNY
jgi:hypothetical protein